jgi:lysophospholipase L1-like esterase
VRNLFFAISFLVLLVIARPTVAAPILKNGDVLAICGDSITEQRLYSVFIESYLLACKPADNLRIVQIGWSGETASGFAARIGSDLLPFHPTVATIFYGMNDGRYGAMTPLIGQTYGDALKNALDAMKAGGVRTVVVGSPGAVDTATYTKKPGGDSTVYNQTLASLTEIAKSVADKSGNPFVDVHSLMMDLMAKAKAKYGKRFAFAGPDGIHPGRGGHLVMAYAFLKALGCEGDLGTITLDLTSGQNTATGGHRILSAANGVVEIESRRIPFCFFGDPASSTSEKSMVDLLPFNQQLNRLTLKVRNAGKGMLRVTWGGVAQAFSSDALAAGINLPAEFPDGPLNGQFAEIEKAVVAQQEYETPLVKTLLHSIPVDKQVVPEESATLDHVVAGAIAHDKALFDAAAAIAAKPARYTIRIEPVP